MKNRMRITPVEILQSSYDDGGNVDEGGEEGQTGGYGDRQVMDEEGVRRSV